MHGEMYLLPTHLPNVGSRLSIIATYVMSILCRVDVLSTSSISTRGRTRGGGREGLKFWGFKDTASYQFMNRDFFQMLSAPNVAKCTNSPRTVVQTQRSVDFMHQLYSSSAKLLVTKWLVNVQLEQQKVWIYN